MAGPSSTHRGWWRDIENARLVAVYDGSQEFAFNASALFPVTSNGSALGTTALMWSDLFLASGAVINFNAGTWPSPTLPALFTSAGRTSSRLTATGSSSATPPKLRCRTAVA